MKELKNSGIFILLAVLFLSCQQPVTYHVNGWEITSNPKDGTLSFSQTDLGLVLGNVHLELKNGESPAILKNWKTEDKNGQIILTAEKPEKTKWTFTISENKIDFKCNNANAFIEGTAPASEKRIPARIAAQDNDVMYTQMGFVSATNVHHLFDMDTDVMIGFTKDSRLTRNDADNSKMDVKIDLSDGTEIAIEKNYYTDVVGLGGNQKSDFKPNYSPIPQRFKTAPTGWSSWYCYYMSPTEESLMAETDALAKKLKPYGLKYVQLDAAYSRGKDANWLNWNKELYPHGGKYWFKYVIDNGLTPGLWLNIHGANYAHPSMADKYPENFYLKDKNGKLSPICCSADKTMVRLDYTNPEAIQKHLKPLFKTLVNDWGLGYLKAGGWGTWMDFYEKNREMAFNPKMDSRDIYREAIKVVREELGDKGYLLGCAMHEIGVGFDYFDGSRTGGDDYANWDGRNHWSGGMQQFFQSLFGTNFINGVCWWSDPDDVMVRDPLTLTEGQTIVTTISLSGQAYIFSDYVADFSKERLHNFLNSKYHIGWAKNYKELVKPLAPEKIDLYKKTMPAMPIKAMDLYPYKTKPTCCAKPKSFPKALDLKVNAASGQYDVVSMYNWADVDTVRTLDFDKDLGIDTDKKYIAFDFWNTKLVNIDNNKLQGVVPKHGTMAVIIRAATGDPQLLATSRHISSAKSIKSVSWNKDKQTLSGVSSTVPGDKYSLYIYVPDGKTVDKATVSIDGKFDITLEDNVMKLSFTGKEEPANWAVQFK
ncbi:MAG: hypothetical protein DSY82_06545 [Flavobacteriia bacterium]|nr:MAG: hypothetical protein DSY82_06545 [Flavobacteriia bacterium]